MLDAIPLNWAAQAFGLDSAGTWLVTFILVVASIGAMVGFELTLGTRVDAACLPRSWRPDTWRCCCLRDRVPDHCGQRATSLVALLQSAMLTAISAGLVLCGSAVLGSDPVA